MRSSSTWRSPSRACIFVAVLSLSIPVQAQSGDAGSTEPAEPPASEAQATPHATGADEAAAEQPVPPGLKSLSPSQRLPENLQGWMRERQRRNPALIERSARSAQLQPALAQQQSSDDPEVDVLKRRLRSFDEGGVTVLSNRRDRTGPVAPALTRVAATAAVSRPAALSRAVAEPAPEEPFEPAIETASVETRSLRALPSRSAAQDSTPRWPAWLAVCAALGLGVVWLRKRRATA
jgi:hypothetical protein